MDRLLGELLRHVHVERGENSQTLAGQHLGRIALGQLVLDVIDEVGGVVVLDEGFARVHRFGHRLS